MQHLRLMVVAMASSVFLSACGPSFVNIKSFEIAERYEDIKSPVDSGKGELELGIKSECRTTGLSVFYEKLACKEPFHISLHIVYFPANEALDSSYIVLQSVKLIDHDSRELELIDGKDPKVYPDKIYRLEKSEALPLGNNHAFFKVPIGKEYSFKGDRTVRAKVKLGFRNRDSSEVFEKKFKTVRKRRIYHMLQRIKTC